MVFCSLDSNAQLAWHRRGVWIFPRGPKIGHNYNATGCDSQEEREQQDEAVSVLVKLG
jgi:hypothetical protein